MSRTRAVGALVAIIGAAGASGVALHRLGSLSWLQVEPSLDWLVNTPPGDAIPALVRTAGTWCAAWIAISTGIHLVSILLGMGRAIDLTGMLVLPAVRRIGRAALVGALAWPAVPAPAVPPPPVVEPAPEPAGGRGLDPDWPGVARLPDPGKPAAGAPTAVIVAPGDNLWRISERVLIDAGMAEPPSRQVARYWITVIEMNRHRLRSGDPDLIFAGEEILLPPLDDRWLNREGN